MTEERRALSKQTLIYRGDAVHISWNETHGYFLSDWQHVFKKGDDLRRAYQACLDAAQTRRGVPWLADASHFAVIDPADLQWIESWFWPEFIRAGVRYEAAVLPQREVSKMSANRSVEKVVASGTLELTVHSTRQSAEAAVLAWLDKRAKR
jgi:hypothetical protein